MRLTDYAAVDEKATAAVGAPNTRKKSLLCVAAAVNRAARLPTIKFAPRWCCRRLAVDRLICTQTQIEYTRQDGRREAHLRQKAKFAAKILEQTNNKKQAAYCCAANQVQHDAKTWHTQSNECNASQETRANDKPLDAKL